MESVEAIARALANAFLAGTLEESELVDRASRTMGRRWRWLRPLARRFVDRFGGRPHPRQIMATRFILSDRGFQRAVERYELRVAQILLALPSVMQPVDAAKSWPLPAICTVEELADWLGVDIAELDWFADIRSFEYKRYHGRLRHYHYRPLIKRFGSVRLIESPKPRLKQIQRRILTGILDHIPSHSSVHGFRRGRSIATFAAPHVDNRVVLRIDLQDFFPTIRLARVQALFRTVGFPEDVADRLAGLSTNATPDDAWEAVGQERQDRRMRETRWFYSQPHLPRGAPTSPALANLCLHRLDQRLAGLARAAGATYTRYADDLAFSGQRDFERVVKRFHFHVCATVIDEGFSVHHRKTRIMRAGVRQRLAGLVVNKRLNVSRSDFDELKATLTNCVRLGAASQNRDGLANYRSHLAGRVSFIEQINPSKGCRLRQLFEQIEW